MSSKAAARALSHEATELASGGPGIVFISTHSAREGLDEETWRQQCPKELVQVGVPLLIVLIDPMLEDPPSILSDSSHSWTPSADNPIPDCCWHSYAGGVRLLALRAWVSEDSSQPLGKLSESLDLAQLCSPILTSQGVILAGCTGHVRVFWDAEHRNGTKLADGWQRPSGPLAIRCGENGGLFVDETKFEPCENLCGAFHYDGPSSNL
eukprot:TRINITY_DN79897_c0_g1_i1.p1 TRINITY_DN79897_c0_g1~~TRINITY_DN79897_c0_g1_i1.p1  ORF type:complete len:221 (+),score=29.53 TRINITY_DN79897_c0_g1_i1:37-663(+)